MCCISDRNCFVPFIGRAGLISLSCLRNVYSQYVDMQSFSLLQMGFFRRRYREIIEAEKNRKDSDESWDWVQKSQWEPGVFPEDPISCYLHHTHVQRLIPSCLPYVEEKNILQIFRRFDTFSVHGDHTDIWRANMSHQRRLSSGIPPVPLEGTSCQSDWRDGRREVETSLEEYGYCIKTSRKKYPPKIPSGRFKSIFFVFHVVWMRASGGLEVFFLWPSDISFGVVFLKALTTDRCQRVDALSSSFYWSVFKKDKKLKPFYMKYIRQDCLINEGW